MLLLYKYAPKDRATRHVITGHLSNLQLSSYSTITTIIRTTENGRLEACWRERWSCASVWAWWWTVFWSVVHRSWETLFSLRSVETWSSLTSCTHVYAQLYTRVRTDMTVVCRSTCDVVHWSNLISSLVCCFV